MTSTKPASREDFAEFDSLVSHDLRASLRGISNYMSFFLEDYGNELNEDGMRMLQAIPRLTKQLEQQIDAVLHHIRAGSETREADWVSADDVIAEVQDALRSVLEERNVEFRVASEFPRLWCHRATLTEVLVQLVSNACLFNDKPVKWVEVGFQASGQEVVLLVRDNGIGISAGHLDPAFSMFRRLHDRDAYGGGVGAGLAIARKLIHAQGGNIWVESELEEGSTFYFTLGEAPLHPNSINPETARARIIHEA